MVARWLESYLSNSNPSSVGCVPSDTSAPDPSGVVSFKHGRSYQGPSELFVASNDVLGGIGTRGVGG
jgi:hypothetical protein